MTYMTKQTDMALGNIQELSFNEIEEIAGGPLPAVAACAANPACVAGVRVGAAAATVAIIAAIDYFF